MSASTAISKSQDSDSVINRLKNLHLYWFLDPLFFGKYPDIEVNLPFNIKDEEMELMKQEIDVLGINYYSRLLWEKDLADSHFQAKINQESSFLRMGEFIGCLDETELLPEKKRRIKDEF